jgi:hypothetical protein
MRISVAATSVVSPEASSFVPPHAARINAAGRAIAAIFHLVVGILPSFPMTSRLLKGMELKETHAYSQVNRK